MASELLDDFRTDKTIERGMEWLLDSRNTDNGWGDFKSNFSNVLCTFEGLDTMIKFRKYKNKTKENEEGKVKK
ncbi:hypothetical protein [Roseburia sp. 1XD42-34]|uniref:hypothetical protein n=1 Tax=Roseburia sp. 1XD42-34 TaxID=2305905 RepID=UPI000EA018C6|nr:hypothetical protein [Roseburia sp. 1XD42-34]NBJ71543.1 hypothetical protein [Roseburia sp. 1XD42-34]RKI74212.1 hypothetical protein D7V87_19190 [Clostridium sp. 1xD42-85]